MQGRVLEHGKSELEVEGLTETEGETGRETTEQNQRVRKETSEFEFEFNLG